MSASVPPWPIAAAVSRETWTALERYHALLIKWQRAINLVAPSTLAQAWERHFVDSLGVHRASDVASGVWADLGSGAGFPGLVCAIAAREERPDLSFVLVESDARKAAFLRNVAAELSLNITIHVQRIEELAPLNAAVVSARALAPLPKLCALAQPHLASNGICLFQKGARWRDELASAQHDWQMNVEVIPSTTADDAVILKIGNLSHA